MAHEFIKGIDWIADPTGATALANHYFVSQSGNDATINGKNPETPFKTIDSAAAAAASGNTIIIGTGIYTPSVNLTGFANARNYKGDGNVWIAGTGVETTFNYSNANVFATIENINTIGMYAFVYLTGTSASNDIITITGCTIIGGRIRCKNTNGKQSIIINNRFINMLLVECYLAGTGEINSSIANNIFYNVDAINLISSASPTIKTLFYNNTINSTSPVNITLNGFTLSYNNIQSIITKDAVVTAIETFNNSFSSDPLWKGDPSKLEFLVDSSSPLLRTGIGNSNIGAVKEGNLQNSLSIQWGTTPAVNVNTEFISTEFRPTVPNVSGTRTSSEIDLGIQYSGITIKQNAIIDFVNYVMDTENAMVNPNHLTFEADWAGEDGIYHGSFEKFRFGIPMMIDGGGLYTGDIGFVSSSTTAIITRYLKIKITVRNDYNQL